MRRGVAGGRRRSGRAARLHPGPTLKLPAALGVELAVQLLRRGQAVTIRARGGSMTPFLRDGDLLRVVPRPVGAVGPGDVVCYAAAGALFFHRVLRRQGHLVIKGDAVAFADVVAPADVLGVVVAVERRGRVRRMDAPLARARNRAIARLSPLLSAVVPAVAATARRLLRRHRG